MKGKHWKKKIWQKMHHVQYFSDVTKQNQFLEGKLIFRVN